VRTIVVAVSALMLADTVGVPAQSPQPPAGEPNIRVILLGTQGGPTFSPQRLGISTLVLAGGERLLFDERRSSSRIFIPTMSSRCRSF